MNDNERLARAIFGDSKIEREMREGRSERMALAHARLWWFFFNQKEASNTRVIVETMQRCYVLAGGQPTFDAMHTEGKLTRMYTEGKA